jgi:hypothetical protein
VAGEQRSNKCPDHLVRHQFKPGQSGNPSGRPKGSVSLTEAMRRLLRARPEEADEAVRIAYEILTGRRDATKGQVEMARIWLDRIDGPVTQRIEHDVQRVRRVELTGPGAEQLERADDPEP